MASGKSTIGKELARSLKKDFFDVDSEIEKSCGAKISWIFDIEGEEGFREREKKILKEILADQTNAVISTGGGIILDGENRKLLKEENKVIYIETSIEEQLERLRGDSSRPLLDGSCNKKKTLSEINSQRAHLYKQCSNISFNNVNKSVKVTVNEIISTLKGGFDE
tara:strand:- start:18667 stop:19164 length:498 start_codon:yes stop_codon:yes gene_type:complete